MIQLSMRFKRSTRTRCSSLLSPHTKRLAQSASKHRPCSARMPSPQQHSAPAPPRTAAATPTDAAELQQRRRAVQVATLCRATAALLRLPGRPTCASLTFLRHYLAHRHLLGEAFHKPSDAVSMSAAQDQLFSSRAHCSHGLRASMCKLGRVGRAGVGRRVHLPGLQGGGGALPCAAEHAHSRCHGGRSARSACTWRARASCDVQVPVSNNHLLNVVGVLFWLADHHRLPLSALLAGDGALTQDPLGQPTAATPAAGAPPPAQPGAAGAAPTAGSDWPAGVPRLSAKLEGMVRSCPMLVGDDYYAAKGQMLDAEQCLLRLRQWKLLVPHPAAALLHVGAAVGAPRALLAAALGLLHDAAAFSDLLLPGWPAGVREAVERAAGREGLLAALSPEAGGEGAAGEEAPWGESEASLTHKEAVVAAACVWLASDLLGSDEQGCAKVACGACRSGVGGVPAGASPGGCAHWVGLLGLHEPLVRAVADKVLRSVLEAREACKAWG